MADLEDLEKRFARIDGTIAGLAENVSLHLAPANDPERTMDSTYCTPQKTSFNIGGIPPGKYILRVTRGEPKRSTEQPITLRAGEELKVELRAE